MPSKTIPKGEDEKKKKIIIISAFFVITIMAFDNFKNEIIFNESIDSN